LQDFFRRQQEMANRQNNPSSGDNPRATVTTDTPANAASSAGDSSSPDARNEPSASEGQNSAETAARPTEGDGESSTDPGNGSGNNPGARTATCRNCVEPEYPQSALEAGAEGQPRVSVQINPDGSVASVTLLRSSGNAAIDQAAIRAAQQSSFQPIAGGASVPIQYDLSIEGSQQHRDAQRRGERRSTEVADPDPPEQPAQTAEEPTPPPTPTGETATESVPPDSTQPQEDSVGDSPVGADENPADPSEPEDSIPELSPEPDPADRPAVSGEAENNQESEPIEPSNPAQLAPTPAPPTPENSGDVDLPEPVAPPPEVEPAAPMPAPPATEPVAPATPEPTPEPVEPAPEPEPPAENAPEEDNS
jgi:TonB family protein